MIGIVGGMGPWATADLLDKISQETKASRDQDHVPVLVLSAAADIGDRTSFLDDPTTLNPGLAVASKAKDLIRWGATVIGIPCNTVHAPSILAPVLEAVGRERFVSIVDETVQALRTAFRPGTVVGLLSTRGTLSAGFYQTAVADAAFRVLLPDANAAALVHEEAIYGADGIKATPGRVTPRAASIVLDACRSLEDAGAEVVVLACTELPIVLRDENAFRNLSAAIVDPTRVLARALVHRFDPSKLR